jgi:ADP-ribose pyrophosphatase YjhB (NUDIX family)
MVRLIDTGQWATIGGAVEPDESPQQAAVREAEEEAGVHVALGRILAVVGGPECRITYPNGDQTSYVVCVFDATVADGTPEPDGDETSAVRWWPPGALPYDEMSALTRSLLHAAGVGG